MKEILKYSALVVVVALLAACDKVPLLAPVNSTITLSANATTIPTGGTVGLTAFVTESSGTPVQNGTAVRFTTTLGAVTPSDAQTTNGIAIATFQAGTASGVAEVHAVSGGATGTTGTGTTATSTNVVKITIGAAAVNTVTVAASPTSVSPNGGSVQVTASVLDANGGSLAGIPVAFTADQGVLSPSTAVSDSTGQATTTLVTAVDTTVTAAAGTKTGTIKVTARAGPGITIACAVAGGATGSSCASIQANASTNSASVTFTVTKAASTSNLRSTTIDFGDGSSQQLGNLAGGSAATTHTYRGPGSSGVASYVATVTATDVNGEVTTATSAVAVTARAPLSVTVAATTGTSSGGKTPVTFTATVKPDVGGADVAQSFEWDFEGDGHIDATTSGNTTTHVYDNGTGVRTVIVKVTTTDGRTTTGQTEVNIP